MRTNRLLATAVLSLLLPLSACSSSSGDGAFSGEDGGDMWVVSCSLGCTNGLGGEPVFCSIVNTYQNQELSILFSEPIELFSVNTSSFRVVNVANGTSPSGQFFLDPLDPRRLIFRPSLSFDSNGNPLFGFTENTTYQISIPGMAQGDGPPYIQSQSGRPNQSRLECTILTSEGIIDPVPGPPSAEVRVTLVTGYDGNGEPNGFEEEVLATKDPELLNVYRSTKINFKFNDIMNVATLLNPSTGKSPFILVEVDGDGTLATLDDRVDVEGSYTFSVDQEKLETNLSFIGDLPFPSAGQFAPLSPRRIAVTIPSSVQDLVSNPVLPDAGGGTTGMVPELAVFGEVTLPYDGGEDFVDSSNEDTRRSGAFWGGGRLVPGVTGGAGQLGDLIVPTGYSVVLNTDSQDFPLTTEDGTPLTYAPDIMGNPDPTGGGDPGLVDDAADFPNSVTITGGGFSFSVVDVLPGASLRFEGDAPAKLWSRGVSTVQSGGEIDLVGATPLPIDSQDVHMPELEIPLLVGAANGGYGGYGADRFDMSGNAGMLNAGDPENDAISNVGADTDGSKGKGVGQTSKGGGFGGTRYPRLYPSVNVETDPNNNNNHELTFNVSNSGDFGQQDTRCRVLVVGQAGGGGAYATDGEPGVSESTEPTADFPFGQTNTPDPTPGGDSSEIGLAPPNENNNGYTKRKLKWESDLLRGGSGGGGGANHPFGTRATGYDEGATNDCINSVTNSRFIAWHDHSGSQGGYGGGALHFVSGKKIVVDGRIDMRGGNGGAPRGQGTPDPGLDHDFGWYAMPGGGGSGGALRMRSLVIDIADVPDRIDLRGGSGGAGFTLPTKGGDGGTGLLRLEDNVSQIDRAEIASSVAPFDPVDNSLSWISVDAGALNGTPRVRPDSMSASTSCWMRPDLSFFALAFIEDEEDENTGDPDKMGWNMTVLWDDGVSEQQIPFRGANTIFNGSFETEFGKLLGYDLGLGESAAPLVVRFQGARVTGEPDLCDLDLNDPTLGLVNDSVTPWVDHPALLNTHSPAPNIIRFAVVYDGTVDQAAGDSPGIDLLNIKGVTNLWIRALPD